MKINPSVVMRIAHLLYKSNSAGRMLALNTEHRPVLRNWSNALRQAWFLLRFKNALNNGIVTFSFIKQDGTIREAKGTTHHLLVPADKQPKGVFAPGYRISTINFFDLDKQDWRSFSVENFIGFVNFWRLSGSNFIDLKDRIASGSTKEKVTKEKTMRMGNNL